MPVQPAVTSLTFSCRYTPSFCRSAGLNETRPPDGDCSVQGGSSAIPTVTWLDAACPAIEDALARGLRAPSATTVIATRSAVSTAATRRRFLLSTVKCIAASSSRRGNEMGGGGRMLRLSHRPRPQNSRRCCVVGRSGRFDAGLAERVPGVERGRSLSAHPFRARGLAVSPKGHLLSKNRFPKGKYRETPGQSQP